jgi:histidine triad (HIT) family protein
MKDCIFCKIIKKEIPAKIVYEDKSVIAFNDINPKAKIHVLVVPKKHSKDISELGSDNTLNEIITAVNKIAEKLDIQKDGYRLINNKGKLSGQSVFHTHFHMLAGDYENWTKF